MSPTLVAIKAMWPTLSKEEQDNFLLEVAPKKSSKPALITTNETAKILNCSRVTIQRLIKKGVLTPIKHGKQNCFNLSEIWAMIEPKPAEIKELP